MRAFVVPDLHGNITLAERLLTHVGVWDGHDRDPEVFVVQLGDLANCVAGSINADLAACRRARRLFDAVLVGNHEHPYFGGPRFSGFFHHVELSHELGVLGKLGLLVPSVEIDGVLLTHAGATASLVAGDGDQDPGWPTAAVADDELRGTWRQNPRAPVFSAIGRSRGGTALEGGVLWADYSEPKSGAFSQVFGHTVGREVRLDRFGFAGDERFHCCLDLGGGKRCARFAGAWLNDGALEIVQIEV